MSGDSGWEHNGACAKGGLSEGGEGHKDCQVNKDRPGEYTWDESVFLEEKNSPSLQSSFLVLKRCQVSSKINSQSLEDTQVGYISQKYSFDKYTLG